MYHHFPNKHALGLAVIDKVIQDQLAKTILQSLKKPKNSYQAPVAPP